MKSIVLIASVGLGHIRPMISIAKTLINQGAKVYFYAPSIYREMVENTGAEYRVILLFEKRYMKKLLLTGFTYENYVKKNGLDEVDQYVNTMLKINSLYTSTLYDEIKNLNPACIVYDHVLYFGKQLAYKIGVTDIAVSSAYFYNPSWLYSQTAYALEKNFLLSNHEIIYANESKAKIYEISEKCGKENGICPFDRYYYSNCMWSISDVQLVFYPRKFQLYNENIDDCVHFLGSYTQTEDSESIKQFCHHFSLGQENKIIYVSLGTNENFNNNPVFFSKIINAFANTSHKVIMSVGNKVNNSDLPIIPDNIKIANFVDQLTALRMASLYITHGGMAGVREALYFNVPMMVLPITFDEFNVADAVDYCGNGVKLHFESVVKKDIEEAVYRVLYNPAYKNKATELMYETRYSGGEDNASEIILRTAK